MLAIAYFFIDLSLLRRPPQDLPASTVLFWLVTLTAFGGGVLLAVTAGSPASVGSAQSVLGLGLMYAALYLGLNLVERTARFWQAATALAGADTLVGLIALLPIGLAVSQGGSAGEESGALALAGLMFLGLVVWSVVIKGHILRHTFGLTLAQGVAIAVAFDLFSFIAVAALTDVGSAA
ncbi:MAG: hypothetical protein EA400_14660 [Chromatiaceae bacterium]|nr:MAG: hypothetical protein EA400_14660 [Chromatiaceae bacterium]